jgi:uncharacterized protein (TIGR00369 family)
MRIIAGAQTASRGTCVLSSPQYARRCTAAREIPESAATQSVHHRWQDRHARTMDKNAYFWQVMDGKLPPPGAAATLNIRFTHIDADAGTIETTFEAGAGFTNPAGHVQGGFLAAMLDDTMGPALAAMLAEGEIAPTLNLNVSYERPPKVGTLSGKGRVLRRGRDVCFLAGELYQDGQRIAAATATALVRKIPPRPEP